MYYICLKKFRLMSKLLIHPHPMLTRLRIYEGNYSLSVFEFKNILNTSENK